MDEAGVLVVGATGILAPLAASLVARGRRVLGVARHAAVDPIPGVLGLTADTTEPDDAHRVAEAGPFADAVLYAPAVGAETLPVLLEPVTGRAVLVLTSAAADPAVELDPARAMARRRPRPGDGVLLLGWSDGPRWHSPAEISDAARATLIEGSDRVLGRVRPWEERP